MHEYAFEFDGVRYAVVGDARSVPEMIVLPDRRVVKVTEILETYPAKIGTVALVSSAMAKRAT